MKGNENYILWNKFFKITVLKRNILILIDETCRNKCVPDNLRYHRKRMNIIVILLLMNSMKSNLIGGGVYVKNAQDGIGDVREGQKIKI